MGARRVLFTVAGVATVLVALAPCALAGEPWSPDNGEWGFRLGGFFPSGDSDGWRATGSGLTLEPSDFNGAMFGFTFAASLNPNLDFALSTDWLGSTTHSSYRNYLFEDNSPITQRETLRLMPVDFSLRILPTGRTAPRGTKGRRVLRPVVPYFGGGVGLMFYEYEQSGNFIDFTDPTGLLVYHGYADTQSVTWSANVLAGIEVQFSPWVAMQVEGRYRWATGELGSDFHQLASRGSIAPNDHLDLGGASLSTGVVFRF